MESGNEKTGSQAEPWLPAHFLHTSAAIWTSMKPYISILYATAFSVI